ncbi:hypothetical protein KO506_06805 [Polaribacter vadi]|uniref:hypothetical protein n=1 Tax=Polaribacter TaxID=52959 RepID=UPI001C091DCA|nr:MULTISPECIES: hypothetical protein [Polaribacter]MBU3011105.1 hypothetical protein [Polaribacter vadi]MDO6740919.1 hypothetical protein [Polaribacter sp. 1_MG-2023]
MPGYNIEGKKVVISDDRHKDVYWAELSSYVKNKYFKKTSEYKNHIKVQEILKDCFTFLLNKLETLIEKENRFSFYLFCHNIHEDSIDIHFKNLQGNDLPINEEKFAGSRRILKVILEQSTKYDLKGTENFSYEIDKNLSEYILLLEEMIYVGEWAFITSENIARSQLFPKSIGILMKEEEVQYLTYQPYPIFFSHFFTELPKHDSDVKLTDCIDDFKNLIKSKYSIEYDDLCYFIAEIITKPSNKLGVTIFPEIIKNIKNNTSVNIEFIDSFYNGLKITKTNALDIDKCFYTNQDIGRHIYKPILEYNIDGKTFHVIGPNKWIESISQLNTNCFPFGLFPNEWKVNSHLKKFIEFIDNTHDKVLQNPIIEKLKNREIPYEIDILRFNSYKKQFINIEKTIGDIDILFIDTQGKNIYVSECKHNRSRFDYNNWKRDYSNFKTKYESQLERKVNWAKLNKDIIENHFKLRDKNPVNLDLANFDIKGIFIINAPTIYMFNSPYKCYTIHDFELLLNNEIVFNDFQIYAEDRKKTYHIKHPYFDNIEKEINCA